MQLFACQACGQRLYFENVRCEHCHRNLGYLPDLGTLSALEPEPGGGRRVLAAPQKAYKFCDNARHGVCNWMLAADDAVREEVCEAMGPIAPCWAISATRAGIISGTGARSPAVGGLSRAVR